MTGWCNQNWYKMIIYPEQTIDIASSVPAKIAGKRVDCTTTPAPTFLYPNGNEEVESLAEDLTTEALIFVPITMMMGLIFLIVVLCRSRSRVRLDWYRLIAVYITVTIGVPLSIQLGPTDPTTGNGGFNRVIGFGILIHNLGELFILNHVWFGDVGHKGRNKFSGIGAILYVWGILALISFLEPLWFLFFVLMLQGSFCDYCLVGTFIYISKTVKPSNVNQLATCCGKPINYGLFGVAAAITHIVSIQPLFYMMAIPNFVLGGAITIVFLMPTFILYIVFSSANKGKVPRVIQAQGFPEMEYELSVKRNYLLKKIAREGGISMELKQRAQGGGDDKDDEEQKESNATATEQEDNKGGNDVIDELQKGDDIGAVTFDSIVNEGLIYMKFGPQVNPRKALKIVAGVGALACISNSLLVLFAPCYIPPPC